MLTLARGLQVIAAFERRQRAHTAADLSRRTGLPRAVVGRCLYTLMQLGYVQAVGRTYVLLPKVLQLGHAYFSSTPMISVAQAVLEQLSVELGATCGLAIFERHEIVYLARSGVQRLLSTTPGLGSRLPAYCTTIGRLLLAELDAAALDAYFAEVELQPYTQATVVTPAELREHIAAISEAGYAIVDQELGPEVRAIAVPVRTPSGSVYAGLNVSVQASRVPLASLHDFLPAMSQAVLQIEAVL